MTENHISETPAVLFVDDEENVLKALKRLFMDEDLEIHTADSGITALAMATEREYSVICSDQKMPGMSGSEFLEKARVISPDSVRMVLTGYADVNTAIHSINKGGAYRYITKPWNDTDLVLTIKDGAEKYRLTRENKYLTELTKRQNEELRKWNGQLEVMVQEQTIDIQRQNDTLRKLNSQLEKSFTNSIEAFSGLMEMRDRSVSNHSRNVAALSKQIAEAMVLSAEETKNIFVAALLHDVGKISVPDSILRKREEDLEDYEVREYRLHPIRGQAAVEAIEGFREIGRMIRHHHERMDGQGYVDGLKGEAIPLGSRIIAIANEVDRLASGKIPVNKAVQMDILHTFEIDIDRKFDRRLYPFLQSVLEKNDFPEQGQPDELETHPEKLFPGQVLSRDIRSGTGLLVLASGVILTPKIISSIQRYYRIDPPGIGVFVLADGKYAGGGDER